jgi:hypothetical protein
VTHIIVPPGASAPLRWIPRLSIIIKSVNSFNFIIIGNPSFYRLLQLPCVLVPGYLAFGLYVPRRRYKTRLDLCYLCQYVSICVLRNCDNVFSISILPRTLSGTLRESGLCRSVYHEVFDKSAENRPLINQPVAVGPAYTGCSRINRLGAG